MRRGATLLMLVLLLADLAPFLQGEVTDTFLVNDEPFETVRIDFTGAERNNSAKLEFPATRIRSASMSITGAEFDGSYPEGVELQVASGVEGGIWRYDGQGYGALGQQRSFATGSLAKGAVFHGAGSQEVELLLPAQADLQSATIDITGYPYGTGDLQPYKLGSSDTNGGSISQTPDVLREADGDLHVVWRDDGDLENRLVNVDAIIYRGQNGGVWQSPKLIASTTSIYDFPQIVQDGSTIWIAWLYDVSPGRIYLTSSDDGGASWSPSFTVQVDGGRYMYEYDLVIDGGTMHLLWSDSRNMSGSGTDYDIWHMTSTDDGDSWSDPVQVNSASSSSTSYQGRLFASGNNLHAVWTEYNYTAETGTRYIVHHTSSSDGGQLWQEPSPLQTPGDSDISGFKPSVVTATVGASTYVYVAWYEYSRSSLSYDVQFRRSTDGGFTFGQVQTISDEDDDGNYLFPYAPTQLLAYDASTPESANVKLAWSRFSLSGTPHSVIALSDNAGSSFGDAIAIDSGAPAAGRTWVALDDDSEADLAAAWGDRNFVYGADMDIVSASSSDGGESWSAETMHSDQYYESVESSSPALGITQDYLHLVYWDAGEVSDNGNNAHNDDGDILHRRSGDNGQTWSDPQIVSYDGAELIYTPRGSYQYQPQLAGSGVHLYAVWLDRDPDSNYYVVRLARSIDQGSSWDEPFTLSEGYVYSYKPAVTADGARVHVAYQENYKIVVRSSDDYGVTWGSSRVLSEGTSNYSPSIGTSGGRVHVAWESYYNSDYEIFYAKSDDHGHSWEEAVQLTNSTSQSAMYASLAADDSGVFVAWRDYGDYDEDGTNDYDVILQSSYDNGDSWRPAVVVSDDDQASRSNSQTHPAIAASNGLLYALWMETPNSGRADDTWVLDLDRSNWTERTADHPAAVYYHTLEAFRSGSGYNILLFGGSNAAGYSNESWIYYPDFDWWGESTSQVDPSARYMHAMAGDWNNVDGEGLAVMFGGYGQDDEGIFGYRNDTWLYHGTRDIWEKLTLSTHPNSRYQHGMAFDNASGKAVLYGGYGQDEGGTYHRFNDTWLFDFETLQWEELDTGETPGNRSYHAMAGDDAGRVIVYGGYLDGFGYVDDTWVLDTASSSWTDLESGAAPEPRYGHAMAYDRANEQMVMFGGYVIGVPPYYMDDTWALDPASGTWGKLDTDMAPQGRYFHDIAYLPNDGLTMLFGGYTATSYDLYMRYSMDQGQTWSDFIAVSDHEDTRLATSNELPALVIGERTFLAFRDNGDIDGAGDDDSDIFVRATVESEYPSGPLLDVGADGTVDWRWSGELNTDNSPITWDSASSPGAQGSSFLQVLEDALEDAETFTDSYGTEMARLRIEVESDSKGVVWLSQLDIRYTVTLTFEGAELEAELQRRVDYALDRDFELATATLWISSQTAGSVIVSDLIIETDDCDLELTGLTLTPDQPEQGDDVDLVARLRNTGDADARVEVTFWYNQETPSNQIGSSEVEVPADGDEVLVGVKWRDVPAGDIRVIARITSSFPGDLTATEDEYKKEVQRNFRATWPEMYLEEFALDGIAVEGLPVDLLVRLNNRGERSGLADITVREFNSAGDVVLFEPGVKVIVGQAIQRSGTWLAHDISRLYLVVTDNETGGIVETQFIDLDVMKLPQVSIALLEHYPQEISDGTTVQFNLTLLNDGSFDIEGNLQLELRKGAYKLVTEPAYLAGVQFDAGGTQEFQFSAVFTETGAQQLGKALYGDWQVAVRFFNVQPQENAYLGIWSPSELEFNDATYTVTVAQPPDLLIDPGTVSINPRKPVAGESAEISFTIFNDGESTATGRVRVLYEGNSEIIGEFTIAGGDMVGLTLEWTIPLTFDGEENIEIQIFDIQPAEAGSSSTLLDNSAKLTFEVEPAQIAVRPVTEGGSEFKSLLVLGLVVLVLVGGLAGTYFVYQRSQEEALLSQPPPPVSRSAPGAAAPVSIQCPRCSTLLKVTTSQRPVIVNCTGCATKLQLDE